MYIDTGTFWYHSHLSTQYCDGLRGAFVVYDPNDPHASLYDVDDGKLKGGKVLSVINILYRKHGHYVG